ncbi:MAG: hypothetical protein ACI4Q3_00590 [Kiritimatiellia bacterium]
MDCALASLFIGSALLFWLPRMIPHNGPEVNPQLTERPPLRAPVSASRARTWDGLSADPPRRESFHPSGLLFDPVAVYMAEIHGIEDVQRAIQDIRGVAGVALKRGLSRIGLIAQRDAKAYAPRSPTNAQYSATLKRKKRTSRKMFPGNLEKSIAWEIVGAGTPSPGVSVFVASNAYCRSKRGFNYAPKIHDERGHTWHNLGPGSIAKNTSGKVGDKFIERAIADNADAFFRILQDEARKAGTK